MSAQNRSPGPIWHNGKLVPHHLATCHVLSHALHYGSAVFEGVRIYATPRGPCAFRLGDHIARLFESARIYRIPISYTAAQLAAACAEVLEASGLSCAYLRPLVYRGLGPLGVVPREQPAEVAIAAMAWGAYLGEEALSRGVDVCVSSWQRLAPNTMPTMAKAAGNYLSSQLIAMEAKRLGFDEGLALDTRGLVSEGPGENLFMVQDGILSTPPVTASILPGITRASLMTLARALGIEVREVDIGRDALYGADELFFCGTAAEITPIRSVDRLQIGAGRRGPMTERLQREFFGLFSGETPDTCGWLQPMGGGDGPPAEPKSPA